MKLPVLKLNDKIEVLWWDAVAHASWLPEREAVAHKPTLCSSMGYFLNVDDICLRLSCSVNQDGERDLMIIPLGIIDKISRLK